MPEVLKRDTGKLRWHLLPFDALRPVVRVLMYGAAEYGEGNWEYGTAWTRYFNAALRHLAAWHQGEDNDGDSGLPHLAHAACCILFLLAFKLRGLGHDDRDR